MSRVSLWKSVNSSVLGDIDGALHVMDHKALSLLVQGRGWINMVPSEWVEIYAATYDEISIKSSSSDHPDKKGIEKDIRRTFGAFSNSINQYGFLNSNKDTMDRYCKDLELVLLTYVISSSRGYCQGLNFLVALFLVNNFTSKEAFILLCYLLKQRHMEVFFSSKCSSLMEYLKIFEIKLKKHNKEVYKHFKTHNFGSYCYAIEWFTTCFVVTNSEVMASCVMDLLLLGLDDIMLRLGLSITRIVKDQLLGLDQEALQTEFKKLIRKVDPMKALVGAFAIAKDWGLSPLVYTDPKRSSRLEPTGHEHILCKTCGKESDVGTIDYLCIMSTNIEKMNPLDEMINTVRADEGNMEAAPVQPKHKRKQRVRSKGSPRPRQFRKTRRNIALKFGDNHNYYCKRNRPIEELPSILDDYYTCDSSDYKNSIENKTPYASTNVDIIDAVADTTNNIIDGSLTLTDTANTIIEGSMNLLWPVTSVFMIPIQYIAGSTEFKQKNFKERGSALNSISAIETYLYHSSFSLVDLFMCQGYDADTEHLLDSSLIDSADAHTNILQDILFKRPSSTKTCNGYLNFKRRRKKCKDKASKKQSLKLVLVESGSERYLLNVESVIECESPPTFQYSVWRNNRR